jgi:CheY-like chemotaxis protein
MKQAHWQSGGMSKESPMIISRVLVVEDELDIQKVIKMSLKFRGVNEVVVANDGEECLAVVGQVKPDVILLDGYETCRRLKSNPATEPIPVIFLTASTQRSEEELCRQAGASGYMTKPFDPITLHERMMAILERNKLPRAL